MSAPSSVVPARWTTCGQGGEVPPEDQRGISLAVEYIEVETFLGAWMSPIPPCPKEFSDDLTLRVRQLAHAWANSPLRPRVSASIRHAWHQLLDAWIADDRLPILVRRMREGRGRAIPHPSGRLIVPTDNSPANWAMTLALSGQCPSVDEVHALFDADAIPVAMAFKKQERPQARFRSTRARGAQLNQLGWKVAHVHPVGIGYKGSLITVPVQDLIAHFRNFLWPGNMFVIPMIWAGLAELHEVADVVAHADEEGQ